MSNLSQWAKDVKKALIDRGMTQRELASELGYGVTTIACVISGRYASSSYATIAQKINDYLGTEGMPERVSVPSEDWRCAVKCALIKKNMTLGELASEVGVTRDKMSMVANGRMMDQGVVDRTNEILGIDVPAISPPTTKA